MKKQEIYRNERGNLATRKVFFRNIAKYIVWAWLGLMMILSIQLMCAMEALKVAELHANYGFVSVH